MSFAAVLFDLDGTLLDTLQDLADSTNAVLASCGFPTHGTNAYRTFVGDGVTKLFQRVLPPDVRHADVVASCAAAFREVYGQRWNVHTRPYDGIPDLLQWLAAQPVKLAVLSNKLDEFTQRCVRELLADYEFDVVLGQRDGQPLKPDPAGALEIRDRLGLPAGQIVYLGDTDVDMQTARAAGMFPVGALWGFRTREELLTGGAQAVIRHPMELVGILDPGKSG
jgi:phosphoglycolate phosphatase